MKHKVLTLLLGVGLMLEAGAVDKTFNDLVELAGPAASNDWFVLWDTSVGDARKISPSNFFATAGLWDFEEGWVTATVYALNDVVAHNTGLYICKTSHTAGTATEPGVGADWATVWLEMVAPAGNTTLATARVAFGDEGNSLTSEAGFEYNASTNTLSVPNASVTGLSVTGAPRTVPSAMAALEVDLTKALNTKTISGNVTLTFSGSLAAGQWSELRLVNTSASAVSVNLPLNVYDGNAGPVVGSLTIPAAVGGVAGRTHAVFSSDGSNTLIYQGGGGGSGGGGFPNPANESLNMGGYDITNAGTVSGTNFTGVGEGLTLLSAEELTGVLPDDVTYGKLTTAKGLVYTPNVIAVSTGSAITVDTDAAENVITLNESTETVAFDAHPETGKVFAVRIVPHTAAVTVTWPSTWSFATGSLRTSIVVPANKPQFITVWWTGSVYQMSGDPLEIAELSEDTTPATTASIAIDQGSGSERTTLAAVKTALGLDGAVTSRTGVRRTQYVNAGAIIPQTTGGPERATVQLATNKIMYDALLFDTVVQQTAGFWIQMPPTWNGSTVTAKAHWTATDGGAGQTVQWRFAARGFGDDQALDQVPGTAQSVSDTLLANGDMHISTTSPAITITGTTAAGTPVYFQVTRDVDNDNLAGNASLLGVVIEYVESSTEPAAQ